jgi:hypothetical protein
MPLLKQFFCACMESAFLGIRKSGAPYKSLGMNMVNSGGDANASLLHATYVYKIPEEI